ncbi:MAG: GAF domain-containing protein [Angelakisella sp.]|jgi:L-methionine (R)-S-oxide reductase|nr:GAF domain-containing protein [Angelakisella sp.]
MYQELLWPREKGELYPLLEARAAALLEGETDPIANMANLSALLWQAVPELNWAGFYRAAGEELVLGPFQGKPACVRIPWGKGVCGTAAKEKTPQLVPDVHAFPGHIACDGASRSELVIPLLSREGAVIGVLDLDSPRPGRFTQEDLEGLLPVARLLTGEDPV